MRTLQEMARQGQYDEVAQMLSQVRPGQSDLNNALASAAFGGHESIVDLLIDRGADPNACPTEYLPALFAAIENKHDNIVRILVRRGADVNQHPGGDWTPLHQAVDIEGDSAWQLRMPAKATLTKLLLELGADPHRTDLKGRRPLDLARNYNHLEAILLLEQYDRPVH